MLLRDISVADCLAHNQEAIGASPVPATITSEGRK